MIETETSVLHVVMRYLKFLYISTSVLFIYEVKLQRTALHIVFSSK